jgi:hypothetical protein
LSKAFLSACSAAWSTFSVSLNMDRYSPMASSTFGFADMPGSIAICGAICGTVCGAIWLGVTSGVNSFSIFDRTSASVSAMEL